MSEEGNARDTRRYVALDIHKRYSVIAGVEREADKVGLCFSLACKMD